MQVEGVNYEINWSRFLMGSSIFIPCLDPRRAKKTVRPIFERLNIDVLMKISIEDGIRGLRIWRM